VGSGGQLEPGAASPGDFDAFDTFVGECFNDAGPVVDCSEPHDNEVFALLSYEGGPTAPYPGDAVVDAFAEEGCVVEFESFVGIDYDASRYVAYFLMPSAETWAAGDREIVCFLYDDTFRQLQGSMRGAAR
jgi:hypothetical protein